MKKTIIFVLITVGVFGFHHLTAQDSQWFGNDHFLIETAHRQTTVHYQKNHWEALTLRLDGLDLSKDGYLILTAKPDNNLPIRIDILDNNNQVLNAKPLVFQTMAHQEASLVIDFSSVIGRHQMELATHLHIYLNPGQNASGTIVFTAPEKPDHDGLPTKNILLSPNPAKDAVQIAAAATFNQIILTNTLGQVVFNQKITPARQHRLTGLTLPAGQYQCELLHKDDSVGLSRLIIQF